MTTKIKRTILPFFLVLTLIGASPAFATSSYYQTTEDGAVQTSLSVQDYVTVTYIENEPIKSEDSNNEGVIVRDAPDIMPMSANVTKTLNLAYGKSYTYGEFYMGSNGPNDPNAGDHIDITISGITSGKYKVIVKGYEYSGILGINKTEVYNYESKEYSSGKIFTVPGEGGVAYSVTVVNTSSQTLKATLSIVTY